MFRKVIAVIGVSVLFVGLGSGPAFADEPTPAVPTREHVSDYPLGVAKEAFDSNCLETTQDIAACQIPAGTLDLGDEYPIENIVWRYTLRNNSEITLKDVGGEDLVTDDGGGAFNAPAYLSWCTEAGENCIETNQPSGIDLCPNEEVHFWSHQPGTSTQPPVSVGNCELVAGISIDKVVLDASDNLLPGPLGSPANVGGLDPLVVRYLITNYEPQALRQVTLTDVLLPHDTSGVLPEWLTIVDPTEAAQALTCWYANRDGEPFVLSGGPGQSRAVPSGAIPAAFTITGSGDTRVVEFADAFEGNTVGLREFPEEPSAIVCECQMAAIPEGSLHASEARTSGVGVESGQDVSDNSAVAQWFAVTQDAGVALRKIGAGKHASNPDIGFRSLSLGTHISEDLGLTFRPIVNDEVGTHICDAITHDGCVEAPDRIEDATHICDDDPVLAFECGTAPRRLAPGEFATADPVALRILESPGHAIILGNFDAEMRFEIINTGTIPLTGVTLTDALHAYDESGVQVDVAALDCGPVSTSSDNGVLTFAGPLSPTEAFTCTGVLPGFEPGLLHANTAAITAKDANGFDVCPAASGVISVCTDSWFGKTFQGPIPRVTIRKFSAGYDANSLAQAAAIGSGTLTTIFFEIRNSGEAPLTNINFTDKLLPGDHSNVEVDLGTLYCGGTNFSVDHLTRTVTFPQATLARGAMVTCSATLPTLLANKVHANEAVVTATSDLGNTVTDADPWWAKVFDNTPPQLFPPANCSYIDYVYDEGPPQLRAYDNVAGYRPILGWDVNGWEIGTHVEDPAGSGVFRPAVGGEVATHVPSDPDHLAWITWAQPYIAKLDGKPVLDTYGNIVFALPTLNGDLDSDGDGFSDAQEILLGSNPCIASSTPTCEFNAALLANDPRCVPIPCPFVGLETLAWNDPNCVPTASPTCPFPGLSHLTWNDPRCVPPIPVIPRCPNIPDSAGCFIWHSYVPIPDRTDGSSGSVDNRKDPLTGSWDSDCDGYSDTDERSGALNHSPILALADAQAWGVLWNELPLSMKWGNVLQTVPINQGPATGTSNCGPAGNQACYYAVGSRVLWNDLPIGLRLTRHRGAALSEVRSEGNTGETLYYAQWLPTEPCNELSAPNVTPCSFSPKKFPAELRCDGSKPSCPAGEFDWARFNSSEFGWLWYLDNIRRFDWDGDGYPDDVDLDPCNVSRNVPKLPCVLGVNTEYDRLFVFNAAYGLFGNAPDSPHYRPFLCPSPSDIRFDPNNPSHLPPSPFDVDDPSHVGWTPPFDCWDEPVPPQFPGPPNQALNCAGLGKGCIEVTSETLYDPAGRIPGPPMHDPVTGKFIGYDMGWLSDPNNKPKPVWYDPELIDWDADGVSDAVELRSPAGSVCNAALAPTPEFCATKTETTWWYKVVDQTPGGYSWIQEWLVNPTDYVTINQGSLIPKDFAVFLPGHFVATDLLGNERIPYFVQVKDALPAGASNAARAMANSQGNLTGAIRFTSACKGGAELPNLAVVDTSVCQSVHTGILANAAGRGFYTAPAGGGQPVPVTPTPTAQSGSYGFSIDQAGANSRTIQVPMKFYGSWSPGDIAASVVFIIPESLYSVISGNASWTGLWVTTDYNYTDAKASVNATPSEVPMIQSVNRINNTTWEFVIDPAAISAGGSFELVVFLTVRSTFGNNIPAAQVIGMTNLLGALYVQNSNPRNSYSGTAYATTPVFQTNANCPSPVPSHAYVQSGSCTAAEPGCKFYLNNGRLNWNHLEPTFTPCWWGGGFCPCSYNPIISANDPNCKPPPPPSRPASVTSACSVSGQTQSVGASWPVVPGATSYSVRIGFTATAGSHIQTQPTATTWHMPSAAITCTATTCTLATGSSASPAWLAINSSLATHLIVQVQAVNSYGASDWTSVSVARGTTCTATGSECRTAANAACPAPAMASLTLVAGNPGADPLTASDFGIEGLYDPATGELEKAWSQVRDADAYVLSVSLDGGGTWTELETFGEVLGDDSWAVAPVETTQELLPTQLIVTLAPGLATEHMMVNVIALAGDATLYAEAAVVDANDDSLDEPYTKKAVLPEDKKNKDKDKDKADPDPIGGGPEPDEEPDGADPAPGFGSAQPTEQSGFDSAQPTEPGGSDAAPPTDFGPVVSFELTDAWAELVVSGDLELAELADGESRLVVDVPLAHFGDLDADALDEFPFSLYLVSADGAPELAPNWLLPQQHDDGSVVISFLFEAVALDGLADALLELHAHPDSQSAPTRFHLDGTAYQAAATPQTVNQPSSPEAPIVQ